MCRHERNASAAGRNGPRYGTALPAGGAIAEETDGVDGLTGATRRDHHAPTLQSGGQALGVGGLQHSQGLRDDPVGIGQPAHPGILAGQASRIR